MTWKEVLPRRKVGCMQFDVCHYNPVSKLIWFLSIWTWLESMIPSHICLVSLAKFWFFTYSTMTSLHVSLLMLRTPTQSGFPSPNFLITCWWKVCPFAVPSAPPGNVYTGSTRVYSLFLQPTGKILANYNIGIMCSKAVSGLCRKARYTCYELSWGWTSPRLAYNIGKQHSHSITKSGKVFQGP